MTRSLPRTCLLLLVAFLLLAPAQSQAGVFKNLADSVGKTLEDYNNDMWTGENSVGKSVLNGKGSFNERFSATAAALGRAQDNAKGNMQAVWKAVKDIVLWLPRKLNALFNKLMGKVRWFVDRLNQINGGGSPGAPVSMADAAAHASLSPSLEDDVQALSGLRDLLSEDPEKVEARRLSPEELLNEMDDGRPADAPGAPEVPDASVFPKIFRMTDAIEVNDNRVEARKRIRLAWVTSLDQALGNAKVQEAADLIRSSTELYTGDPAPMVRAMDVLAKRHPRYAATLTKTAKRMENLATRASQDP